MAYHYLYSLVSVLTVLYVFNTVILDLIPRVVCAGTLKELIEIEGRLNVIQYAFEDYCQSRLEELRSGRRKSNRFFMEFAGVVVAE